MSRLTEQEVENLCSQDYENVVGKVVHLRQIECFDHNEDSVTVYCDPPVLARIEPYAGGSRDQCILRWMDDEHCDPVYDISILERHEAFEASNARPSWIYGTCRSTSGKVEPPPFTVAEQSIQDEYGSAEAVDYRDVGPKEPADAPKPFR